MTIKYLSSSFSSTHFNSHLSTGFNTLMPLPNCSFSEIFMEEYLSMWKQIAMVALNMSCKIKKSRRLQFPYFFSSHSFHSINKVGTAKNCNYRNGTSERLQEEVNLSVESKKTVLIKNLSHHSIRSCFKFLSCFSSNRSPIQKTEKF